MSGQTRLGIWAAVVVAGLVLGSLSGGPVFAEGPSFSCQAKLNDVEVMICADEELAALDAALAPVFVAARAKAEKWGPQASDWFMSDARADLGWRNRHCVGDRHCLLTWFVKRRGVMRLLAEAENGFGVEGRLEPVSQLENGDLVLSFAMGTYHQNVLYRAQPDRFELLPDGLIKVLSVRPLLYRVDGQKGYFAEGGAFWFNSIRDDRHRIIQMVRADDADLCMKVEDFVTRTNFPPSMFDGVADDEICLST